jgi:hypothetical protein
MSDTIHVRDVALALGITTSAVYTHRRDGNLVSAGAGLVTAESFNAYLEKRNKPKNTAEFIHVSEAAEMMKLSVQSVSNYTRTGVLVSGGRGYVTRASVEAYVTRLNTKGTMTIEQAAEYLGITAGQASHLIEAGQINRTMRGDVDGRSVARYAKRRERVKVEAVPRRGFCKGCGIKFGCAENMGTERAKGGVCADCHGRGVQNGRVKRMANE